MAPTPPPFASARSVSSKIRFFSSALNTRRCALAGTSESGELVTKGTVILASLTTILLAALLCNYGRGECLIDIGTEGIEWTPQARADVRGIDRQTALRLLEGLADYALNGHGDIERRTPRIALAP